MYEVSGLMGGKTGDVDSGLVPGLNGYGVSNRLPAERKKDRDKMTEKRDQIQAGDDKSGMNINNFCLDQRAPFTHKHPPSNAAYFLRSYKWGLN